MTKTKRNYLVAKSICKDAIFIESSQESLYSKSGCEDAIYIESSQESQFNKGIYTSDCFSSESLCNLMPQNKKSKYSSIFFY